MVSIQIGLKIAIQSGFGGLTMKSAALYITTVLIWGSTWLAIEFQLGDIAVELSLFYRFAIAALLMWLYVAYKKPDMRFSVSGSWLFCFISSVVTLV